MLDRSGLDGPRLSISLIIKAEKRLKIADHILHVTYPMIKDVKLLLSVIDNLFLASANAITSLLVYEKFRKNIDNFKDNFDSKFKIFKNIDYGFDAINLKTNKDIREIVEQHRKSSIDFRRKSEFIIITDDFYSHQTINEKIVKKYLKIIKDFIRDVKIILNDKITKDYQNMGVTFKY